MNAPDPPRIGGRPFVGPPIQAVIDLHGELLEAHGGAPGLRDRGALESALARPFQLLAYGTDGLSVPVLAAAACFSVLRNHPFVDGNKRAAFVTLGLVLGLNGHYLDAPELEAARVILQTAAGEIDEAALCAWIVAHTVVDE